MPLDIITYNKLQKAIKDGNNLAGWTEESEQLNGKITEVDTRLTSELAQITHLVPAPNGVDDTDNIQNVINSGVDEIRIPDGTYLINGIKKLIPKSNQKIVLSKNAILKLIPNSASYHQIFLIKNVSNVTISGGTLIGERYEHTGTDGQWGHGIDIGDNAENIVIENAHIKDFWGDGIYVGGTNALCKNIYVNNVISENNRRQGMSISYAKNVFVSNSTFKNSNGSAPEAGIDIEPNPNTYSRNIVIDKCQMLDNAGSGIDFVNSGIFIEEVKVSDCVISGNRNGIGLLGCKNVEFSNCKIKDSEIFGIGVSRDLIDATFYKVLIEKSGRHGVSLVASSQIANTENLNFYECVFRNNSQSSAGTYDGVRVDHLDTSGFVKNINFTSCKFLDDQTTKTQRYGFSGSSKATISNVVLGIGCSFGGNMTSGYSVPANMLNLIANTIQIKKSGATASRPSNPTNGEIYYDSTLGKLIVYHSSQWRDGSTGTIV